MEPSISKAERTRQFILEKTAPVFNRKGFAGTSLSDLTGVTGLTKGSIYGNFSNKDEVALAAFDHNFEKVNAFLKARILASDHALERLLTYPRVYRDFLKTPVFRQGCPILNTSTEADDTHPALRRKAAEALAYWKRSVENQVKRGIARKELKATARPSEVAVVLTSLIEGAVMQAKVTGRSTELKAAMHFLEEYIRGLAR